MKNINIHYNENNINKGNNDDKIYIEDVGGNNRSNMNNTKDNNINNTIDKDKK